jgi:hypothetical protein
MPILVECPGCGAKLNAPDSGAGKKVRCPKPGCGTLIPVPAAVTAEADEAPVPASPAPRADDEDRPRGRQRDDDDDRPSKSRRDDDRPRKSSRRDDEDDRPSKRRRDDDDDDRRPARRRRDDEDERPRRGRSSRKKGTGAGKVVAIALGSILVLGGIGYAIYAMLGGSKTAPPAGWTEYAYRDDGFKAHFPKEPQVSGTGDIRGGFGGGKGGGGFGGGFGDFGGDFVGGSVTNYSCGNFNNDSVHIEVLVTRYPSGVPSFVRDSFAKGVDARMGGTFSGLEIKTVRWMGVKALQITTPANVTRMAVTDKAVYHAMITGKNGSRATKQEEDGFFDNFVPAN